MKMEKGKTEEGKTEKIKKFEDLAVWQEGVRLSIDI